MQLQQVLDETVRALEAGDFAAYRRRNGLPCLLVADDRTMVLGTEAELKQNFADFSALVRRDPTLRMTRRVVEEIPLGVALVLTRVETRVERAGRPVLDPFNTLITWRLGPEGWQVVVVVNPVRGQNWPAATPGLPAAPAAALLADHPSARSDT